MLPSRAIGNVLFPTYEVVIMSLSHSSALLLERIKCSSPLVDNHSQFADNSGFSVKYMLLSPFIKIQCASSDRSYIAYKYPTLATRQSDVVVVRIALTAAMVVPSTMFKVYDPPNSETPSRNEFPSSKYDLRGVHIYFPIRKLVFTVLR